MLPAGHRGLILGVPDGPESRAINLYQINSLQTISFPSLVGFRSCRHLPRVFRFLYVLAFSCFKLVFPKFTVFLSFFFFLVIAHIRQTWSVWYQTVFVCHAVIVHSTTVFLVSSFLAFFFGQVLLLFFCCLCVCSLFGFASVRARRLSARLFMSANCNLLSWCWDNGAVPASTPGFRCHRIYDRRITSWYPIWETFRLASQFYMYAENGWQWRLYAYIIVHTILPPSPVILWIELGGKLPLNFGYHYVKRMTPCVHSCRPARHCQYRRSYSQLT